MSPRKPKDARRRPDDERSPIDGRTVADRRRRIAELLLKGYVDLAALSDSELTPELREIRDRHGKQIADAHARQMDAAAQRAQAAKRSRSSRKSPIRAKILEVMRVARDAWTFDNFLERWLDTPRDELEVTQEDDRYSVEDTRAGGEATYTRAALRNLWTQAGK